MNRLATISAGIAATLVATLVDHWPLGAGERLATSIEASARAELDRQEMTMVKARLSRRPLRRTLVLSGPADDFQRSELVRLLVALPGVGEVRWDPASLPVEGRPR